MNIRISYCLLLFLPFLLSATITHKAYAELSVSDYPELQKLFDKGAIRLSEIDYTLQTGWWQYTQSCDRKKWISYNQKFDRRQYRGAACDQQKHDFASVVEPTLNKTVEFSMTDNGQIFILSELQASDDNLRRRPTVKATINKTNGSAESFQAPIIGYVLYGSNKKIPPNTHLPSTGYQVKQGDLVRIEISAGWWGAFDGNWIPAQGAEVEVLFSPEQGVASSPQCTVLKNKRKRYSQLIKVIQGSIRNIKKQIASLNNHSTSIYNRIINRTLGSDVEWNAKNLMILKYGSGGGSAKYLIDPEEWIHTLKTQIILNRDSIAKAKFEIAEIDSQLKALHCK